MNTELRNFESVWQRVTGASENRESSADTDPPIMPEPYETPRAVRFLPQF